MNRGTLSSRRRCRPGHDSGPIWENRITRILGSSYPIIQGAMRLITLGEMAAAVAECGGFGQVAASGLPNERLRAELKRARELTDRPIGVNIPIYRPNAFDALEIAIEMGVKTVTTSAGDPAKLIGRIREAGLKVLHKVSNEKMARKAEAAGVDGVIVTGFEAGGHVGRENVSTLCMVPQLVDVLRIPVVAAGGIGDARGLVAAFALGAEGVEIGTRFVATPECPVPSFFKHRVCAASSDETFILGKKAMPVRVLRNELTKRMEGSSQDEVDAFLNTSADARYVQEGGNQENAAMPCGQCAGIIRSIQPVSEIFRLFVEDAKRISAGLQAFFGGTSG